MANILQKAFFKCISCDGIYCIVIQMSLKFILKRLSDTMSALVQVIAWCHQTASYSLPGPMMPQFIDAYVRHHASVC